VEPSGILVAYAARAGQQAEDGTAGNSPFAAALAATLQEPGLEVGKIFRKVRDRVLRETNGRQEPFTYGSLPAVDLYFLAPKVGVSEQGKVGLPQASALTAPIEKFASSAKRLQTTSVRVSDVEGIAEQPITLAVDVQNIGAMQDIGVLFSQIPAEAILSAGDRFSDGNWLVPSKQLERLSLVYPSVVHPKHFTVTLTALNMKNGALEAPTQEMRISVLPRLHAGSKSDFLAPIPGASPVP
jgi:hypothetical protein